MTPPQWSVVVDTLVISRRVSFATEHPAYSQLVRQLIQSGSRYTVVVPEEAALHLAFVVASCIRKASGKSAPIRTVVYGIELPGLTAF